MPSLGQISHEDLKNRLRSGYVKFYFRKLGGELRIAIGTLDLSRIPSDKHPKGGKGPNRCTVYYDLEKENWRSISESMEIWIEPDDMQPKDINPAPDPKSLYPVLDLKSVRIYDHTAPSGLRISRVYRRSSRGNLVRVDIRASIRWCRGSNRKFVKKIRKHFFYSENNDKFASSDQRMLNHKNLKAMEEELKGTQPEGTGQKETVPAGIIGDPGAGGTEKANGTGKIAEIKIKKPIEKVTRTFTKPLRLFWNLRFEQKRSSRVKPGTELTLEAISDGIYRIRRGKRNFYTNKEELEKIGITQL